MTSGLEHLMDGQVIVMRKCARLHFTFTFLVRGTLRHCLWTGPCGGKGDDIAAFLLDVVSRFKLKLEKNVCMTTDTAKAERAGTHLAKMFRNDCGDH